MSGLRVERTDGGARLRLILDRPKGNVITSQVIAALRTALDEVKPGRGVKLIALEAAGPDFSYGASVEEHVADRIAEVLPELHATVLDLLRVPAPTIAAVHGRCLGGGFELVLACDLVFATGDAVLGVPEVGLGVFPPAAAAILPMRVGPSRAARAILGGDALPAPWWAAAGLIDRVVAPPALLDAEVDQWFASHLLNRSAAALAHAAEAARASLLRTTSPVLGDLERQYLDRLMRTHDASEGIAAFLERRTPRWRNA
ncbi:MAG TPA: enoyl-CoA hydratase/isomerase family protein [Vicinamibacterales bacterium]|nr:enoyl-CoA hydratase/isomerase family protein [Vicinamibacterales bacterium]